MEKYYSLVMLCFFTLFMSENISAQTTCTYNPETGRYERIVDNRTVVCGNTLITAVPFLRITPDARSSGLGDMGAILSPDANSGRYNAATTAFGGKGFTAAVNYSPWLQALVDDVNIFSLSGAYKWDNLQAVSMDITYFNLGTIEFTNASGNSLGQGNPIEMNISANYARKLSDKFSLSAGGNFIYSNLAAGQTIGTNLIQAAKAFAVDLGMRYETPIGNNQNLVAAIAIQDLGTKIKYTDDPNITPDFMPSNFTLGLGYEFNINDYNSLAFYTELNKLLVPTPVLPNQEGFDDDNDSIPDYQQRTSFEAAVRSFGDAPNGFREEMQEIIWSIGAEYWYNDLLALRLGYFNEHAEKGNRKYITTGIGLKYSYFGFNFSYLVPTNSARGPLDNTIKFSLLLDLTDSNDQIVPES